MLFQAWCTHSSSWCSAMTKKNKKDNTKTNEKKNAAYKCGAIWHALNLLVTSDILWIQIVLPKNTYWNGIQNDFG